MTRVWDRSYFDDAVNLHFVLDASPYGLGGVAYVDGVHVEFFWSDLTEHDERIHKYKRGDSRGQQCWECLVVLVATRAFSNILLHRKASIKLRPDNMSALTLVAKLKCTGHSNLIAREVAMIYARASFQPRCVGHLPGIINTVPDALSRLSNPNSKYTVPEQLAHLQPVPVPIRSEQYYATLATA